MYLYEYRLVCIWLGFNVMFINTKYSVSFFDGLLVKAQAQEVEE